ncbi:MAG TPA: cation-transporting P-type ATPase [Streptosporangiaceae bacterium]|nr:cation-transporting P-type ATPase [Streptosporangiaceae bacterium]
MLEPRERLLRDLQTSEHGLSSREAARRLLQYGPNMLRRRVGARWPGEIARQLTHPLALLLWVAALLSFAVGSQTVAIAVVLVIILNATLDSCRSCKPSGRWKRSLATCRSGRPCCATACPR